MEFVRTIVSGVVMNTIVKLPESLRNSDVEVIILPTKGGEPRKRSSRRIGIAPGPEIPDSFFEPLPEEELQAWEM